MLSVTRPDGGGRPRWQFFRRPVQFRRRVGRIRSEKIVNGQSRVLGGLLVSEGALVGKVAYRLKVEWMNLVISHVVFRGKN